MTERFIYTGRKKEFPKEMLLLPYSIYEGDMEAPNRNHPFHCMRVIFPKGTLILPYETEDALHEDWMDVDKQKRVFDVILSITGIRYIREFGMKR